MFVEGLLGYFWELPPADHRLVRAVISCSLKRSILSNFEISWARLMRVDTSPSMLGAISDMPDALIDDELTIQDENHSVERALRSLVDPALPWRSLPGEHIASQL